MKILKTKKINSYLFFAMFLLVLNSGFSQESQVDEKKTEKELKKEERKEKRELKIASGKPLLFPIIAPGYTPELGGLLVVGGLISFKTNTSDTLIQRSSLPLSFSYSTRGSIVFNAFLKSFWLKDKLRIFGDFWYKDMPDHYWGVGYENGMDTPRSDSTTAYNRKWWWINPQVFWQFKKNLFLGVNIDFNSNKGFNASEGVANDSIYQEYNGRPFNSGIGIIIRLDSRDVPVDTHTGILFDLRTTFYGSFLGGQNNFRVYQVDYKQFVKIKNESQILGWFLKGRFSFGDVPYGEMSQLGSPFDLRGYYWGRFRDNNMIFFLSEYRHRFMNKKGNSTRHGPVIWAGAGTIFSNKSDPSNNFKLLPNFGVGYRLELLPRMNARLDFGIGKNSTGFYFNFNQAF